MHVKPLFWNIWPNYIAANDHDDAKSMDTNSCCQKIILCYFFIILMTVDCLKQGSVVDIWCDLYHFMCWFLFILHVAKQKISWLENCNEVWESCLTDCPLWHLDCELILSEEGFVWNSGCKENCHWQAN